MRNCTIEISVKNKLLFLIILIFNAFLGKFVGQEIQKIPKKEVAGTLKKDTVITLQEEQLTDILRTKADSERNDFANKMTYLLGNAQITYQDMQIDADYIRIDHQKNLIYARGKVDDKGNVIASAVANQGGKKYEYRDFEYNFKTKQAIAYDARTEENEGVIIAAKTKKYNDSVFHMRRGMFTTDQYFLEKKDSLADYHLMAKDIKLLKGKNSTSVVTGPIQMYIEQVPTPLIMPFAILPFSEKRSAGILIPSFGERQDVGFFLNGLGYYQPIGKHFDLKILADVYTKGSFNLRPELNYLKKYKYNGAFTADIGHTVVGIKGLDSYNKTATYRISWRHSQDAKANPLLTFNASVDIVSSKFYNNTINNNYIFNQNVLNTQQNSSISLTKRFLTLPVTITANANYGQNFQTGTTDLRLPTVNVAVAQFYLFKPKTGVRQGLLENINVNTSLNFNNYVNLNQGEIFTPVMWEKMQTGLQAPISLQTNSTIAKYFTFSLSANIENAMTTKTVRKHYNPMTNQIETTVNRKVAGFSTFGFGASLQTTLYGMKMFSKNATIRGIRHMMSPSIGFNYRPDFGKPEFGYYRMFQDANGLPTAYSIFEGGIVGTPSMGTQGSLTYSINNNIEMKVASKKDSTGVRKIKIFEALNISGSYNFAAEKHRFSTINISGQTSLLENKLRINSSIIIDPYRTNIENNQLIRTEKIGQFGVQSFGMQLSFPMNNETFNPKRETDLSKKYKTKGEIRNEKYYFDEDNYAQFTQSWTLNVNANYGYTRSIIPENRHLATVSLDGTLALTPYWNINGSIHYDFISKSFQMPRIGFARDQRSFTIHFNWVPFGQYKVYDFFIGIKANILSDALKYKQVTPPINNAPF